MDSGGMFVLGGLLQGLGTGIQQDYENKRAQALANLKRQQDIEDRDANNAAAQNVARIQAKGRIDVVEATGEQNRLTEQTKAVEERTTKIEVTRVEGEEERKTEGIKFANDRALKQLESNLRKSEDAAATKLAAELKSGEVQSVETGADGTPVVVYKDGRIETKAGIKLHIKPSDSDEGASISGERGKRDGGTAPAPADTSQRDAALAALNSVYQQAQKNPAAFRERYPAMFDANGKLLPLGTLRQQVNQRFGG